MRSWPELPPDDGPRRAAGAPFAIALALFPYEGIVGEGIRAAKYGGRALLASPIAGRLHEAIRGRWADRFPDLFCPAIVPVPIRPMKYFRRGYNFPALVGRSLAELTGWPFEPLLLRRTMEHRPQAGLPLDEREKNVRNAFRAAPGRRPPADILLLDDVYTSGATAAACARALKSAGARTIVVLTAARAVL